MKITKNKKINFGRPSIKGVPAECLIERFIAGDSLLNIADEFDKPIFVVEEALRDALKRCGLKSKGRKG